MGCALKAGSTIASLGSTPKVRHFTGHLKTSVAATRGGFRFLALDTLAKRYGAGGIYVLPRSLGLTDYKLGVSRGLGREAVETLQNAEDTLPKNIESIELKDLSGVADTTVKA